MDLLAFPGMWSTTPPAPMWSGVGCPIVPLHVEGQLAPLTVLVCARYAQYVMICGGRAVLLASCFLVRLPFTPRLCLRFTYQFGDWLVRSC